MNQAYFKKKIHLLQKERDALKAEVEELKSKVEGEGAKPDKEKAPEPSVKKENKKLENGENEKDIEHGKGVISDSPSSEDAKAKPAKRGRKKKEKKEK